MSSFVVLKSEMGKWLVATGAAVTLALGGSLVMHNTLHAEGALCGVQVRAVGGLFSPTICELQKVAAGESACTGDPRACPPSYDYVLLLKDDEPTHLRSLTLSRIKNTKSGTYFFNAQTKDFVGQVLDQGRAVRNLENGTLTLAWQGDRVTFSLDASFSNSIRIQTSGTIPVKTVAAP